MDFKLRTNAKYFSDDDILADLRKVTKIIDKKTVYFQEDPLDYSQKIYGTKTTN